MDLVDRKVPSNVKKNVNFYQTNFFFNSSWEFKKGIFSRGNPNTARDPLQTTVLNSKWNHLHHSTIDERTKQIVINYISTWLSR